jgi:hypothetical protein
MMAGLGLRWSAVLAAPNVTLPQNPMRLWLRIERPLRGGVHRVKRRAQLAD